MLRKFFLFSLIFVLQGVTQATDSDKDFLSLFIKIQNLEKEIAQLRNEIEVLEAEVKYYESQNKNSIDGLELKVLSLMSLDNLQNAESTLSEKSDQLLNSYEEAIILIQKGNLVEAVNALNNFVTNNQDDEQTPLAYFWLGELNLSQNNLALSIQNFNTLIGLYPSHWRVPLAKYKLGTIYLEQGNTNRAKTQFEFVIAEYPDSSAAKASRESLDSLE